MIKKEYVRDFVKFELCHRKAWSLWLIDGNTRFFITCKKKDMASLLGENVKTFCEMLEELTDKSIDVDSDLSFCEEEKK